MKFNFLVGSSHAFGHLCLRTPRYFCPHLGEEAYPLWQPSAALENDCFIVDRDDLAKAPLPPRAKVLVYGNSHLRQVSVVCQEPTDLPLNTFLQITLSGYFGIFHDPVLTFERTDSSSRASKRSGRKGIYLDGICHHTLSCVSLLAQRHPGHSMILCAHR